ncbi:MAG: AAA family ATPase [Gallionella sp.]|nr:AAA family ATPase [Gallionella sp.]
MYLEKINIKKFRVLEDIEVYFQPPKGATADAKTGNVVNVIAGVNGCGKTSLLESIGERKNPNIRLSIKNSNIDARVINAFSHKQNTLVEDSIRSIVIQNNLDLTESNPQIRQKQAVELFNEAFDGFGIFTRFESLDTLANGQKPLFKTINGELVTLDKLSSGEKQLYRQIAGLMLSQPNNSLVLIDEPEFGLHPAWQQKIMQIYSRIGHNNQFIIATHSPQIIANTPYQNLILLHKQDHKIVPLYPSHPPSGVDVNSILSEMMWVEQFLPPDVLELREQYRHLIEQKLENSPEAEAVKQKLLQRESNDSKFMQEMRFLLRLRGGQ